MKTKLLYVPEHLHPASPPDLQDAVHYILHRIYVGRALWETAGGFTKLNAAMLFSVCRNYKEAVTWLLANGIVECDGYWKVGEKSLGYRWKQPFSYGAVVRVEAGNQLSATMTERSRKSFREYHKTHKHLFRWLQRVQIDAAKAKAFVAGIFQTDPNSPMTTEEYRSTVASAVQLVHDGEFEFSVCNFGRVHTAFPRMLKDLRQFISVDGEPLVNIDICNSQPLMLCLLLQEAYRSDVCVVSDCDLLPPVSTWDTFLVRAGSCMSAHTPHSSLLVSPNYPQPPSLSYKITNKGAKQRLSPEYTRGNEQKETIPNSLIPEAPQDVLKYVELCQEGILYETMMQQAGIEVTDEKRRKFKAEFFEKVLYGRMKKDWKLAKIFREQFPNVFALIVREKEEDYRALSWKMQRAESRLMIDTVCYRLMVEHPEVPLITIHDSIMTTGRYHPFVTRVIRDEFARNGLLPKLKVEMHSNELCGAPGAIAEAAQPQVAAA